MLTLSQPATVPPVAAGARWRTPEFIAAASRAASAAQLSRFKKMYHEPFFLLGTAQATATAAAGTCVRFTVSGSSQQLYTVTLRATGELACSCKDSAINTRRLGCVCKHICFVVFRVLRIDDPAFLQRLRLSPEDVSSTCVNVLTGVLRVHDHERQPPSGPTISAYELDRLCRGITTQTDLRDRSPSSPPACDFTTIRRPPTAEDECPVCYMTLLGTPDLLGAPPALVGCPDCGNAVHRECIARWLHHAPQPSCVYCRSTVWRTWHQ